MFDFFLMKDDLGPIIWNLGLGFGGLGFAVMSVFIGDPSCGDESSHAHRALPRRCLTSHRYRNAPREVIP